MRRRGEVVSKREILAHVWDYDFEGDPNIVEVYVRHLRSKIDRPFGRDRRSRPSAGAATGWWPTVAEHRAAACTGGRSGCAPPRSRSSSWAWRRRWDLTVLGFFFRDALLGELETSARLRAGELVEPRRGRGPADRRPRGPRGADHRRHRPGARLDAQRGGLPVLARPAPDDAQEARVPVDPGAYLFVTDDIETAAGPRTLLVGVSTEGVTDSTRAILGLVVIGLPILLLLVATTTWVMVGRALAPVEAIRRDVDSISAAELHRRVPDLPGDDEISRLARTMNNMLEPTRERPAAATPVRLRRLTRTAHPGRVDPPAPPRWPSPTRNAGNPRQTSPNPMLAEDLQFNALVDRPSVAGSRNPDEGSSTPPPTCSRCPTSSRWPPDLRAADRPPRGHHRRCRPGGHPGTRQG